MKTVIVAGDLVSDHNLVEYPAAPESHHEPFAKTVESQRDGGAWYLKDLLELSLGDLKAASQVTIESPPRSSPGRGPSSPPVASAYAIWAPFDRKEGDDEAGKVWRIARFLGCQRPNVPPEPPPSAASGEISAPDLLVLDDLSLGFNDHEQLWPECLKQGPGPRSVLLKLTSLPEESRLFAHLTKTMADRLTAVLSVRLLRVRGAAISQALSWDRTIEETVKEFATGRSADDLACCRRVIVHFRTAGVASFTRCRLRLGPPKDSAGLSTRLEFERFLYFPDELEGTWESVRPGTTFGTASILTAAMARHELAPDDYPLYVALGRGLASGRICHELGGGNAQDEFRSDAAHEAVAAHLHPECSRDGTHPPLGLFTAFPHQPLSSKILQKQPASKSNLLRDLTGAGFEYMAAKAVEVVVRGKDKALRPAPKARYGKYFTVDREEIERINAIYRLLKTYLENSKDIKPLSIAVFGPPGSGKSFAIKQLAEQLFGEEREAMEFNLSQFGEDGVEQLREALHQVHDKTVEGKIPLVFWDEFDTDNLKWLKHFLVPMQDAQFQAAGHIHPLGKAIFVFAGGTRPTFEQFDVASVEDASDKDVEQFKAVKGPDFVSRLRGFVNIKGPNPAGGEAEGDPAHLIRRAIVLRGALERFHEHLVDKKTGLAAISRSVIRGFLRAKEFLHGARSMESLIAACNLTSARHFGAAELPPVEQLRLHVTSDFLDCVREGELEAPIMERLAEAIHEGWRNMKKQEDGKDEDPSDPRRRPYRRLSEEHKEPNRASARVTQAQFHEAGWRLRRRGDAAGSAIDCLDPAVLRRLLEIEHDRWMREKLLAGFEWAEKEEKEEEKKKKAAIGLHCDIAPFSDVPPEHQKYDEAIVSAVCNVLAKEGYHLTRLDQ